MRAPAAFLIVLLAPFALAAGTPDVREVVANAVLEPGCPGYTALATIACFDTTGASSARVVVRPDVGTAQPRMLVQLQNATVQHRIFWMCDDGEVGFGGANVTRLVVSLHEDRGSCPARQGLVARGTLTVTPSSRAA